MTCLCVEEVHDEACGEPTECQDDKLSAGPVHPGQCCDCFDVCS